MKDFPLNCMKNLIFCMRYIIARRNQLFARGGQASPPSRAGALYVCKVLVQCRMSCKVYIHVPLPRLKLIKENVFTARRSTSLQSYFLADPNSPHPESTILPRVLSLQRLPTLSLSLSLSLSLCYTPSTSPPSKAAYIRGRRCSFPPPPLRWISNASFNVCFQKLEGGRSRHTNPFLFTDLPRSNLFLKGRKKNSNIV